MPLYMPLPSVFQAVQDCRLRALKRSKRSKPFRRPPRQQLLQLHAPAICFSGGSRLPFARPQTLQTLQTLPQASKATTLTAIYSYTCPCHLFFRGFKTAVCPPSNAPNAPNPSAGLQGNNSYSYMPLPSVFQGVQDCRLPALKRSKPFRRPPRQQLLQLHAPAICFSGGSRLPFARPQTLQTLPQASKATTLTATCPCHLFFRGFKTAVCPPSKTPNPSAGLQGNNSYSYMPLPSVFQGVQDCRLPALKRSKRFRRPPRQQLLQLHASAICFSGGSRLPFARPQTLQTLQTLPQASKATTLTATAIYMPLYMPLPSVFQGVQDCRLPALKRSKRSKPFRRPPRQQLLQLHAPEATTLTATCLCHLFFRGFKTAVCPPSNAPNPSAGLQGNNSYSYMPLPSVFQGVQDCRLPSKPFRRPPRQQLLQLHAPAICFSGGSRLPFARPQTLQTLQTPPQASKATTLTATAIYMPLYMPLPSVFQGVQDCRLPALKRSKRSKPFRRPPRQQLLQLHVRGFKTAVCPPSNAPNAPNPSAGLQGNNSYSYMPLPSVFQGVQDCRLPALKRSKPFRRPPRQQLLQLHASAICFSGGSRLPFARPQTLQTLQTLPQASKATTLTATCRCHLFFRGFKTAACLALNAPNPSADLQGNNSYSYMPLPSVFQGVQDCRLPGFKRSKPFRRPPRQQLLQLHAPAICFSGGARLPFARPQTLQTLQTLPQASKATTLTATAIYMPLYMPLPSVFQGVQDCRLRALKRSKRSKPFRRPPRQQLLQLHAPAIWFSGGSRLPFARPPTLQTLPQASKATTLTATCPCHLFFRGFKTAVCPPSNAPNASAGLQGNNSYSYMPLPSVFQGVQDCRLPALKRSKPFRRPPRQQLLQLELYTCPCTCPCHLFFKGFKTAVCPPSNAPNAPNPSAGLQGNNSYSYMPLRQQLLQLHASAICFSGGSRLPFARPQTLQTLPQASKATTLTATCRCHLFFRGFKTAVCPPSNAPNPSAGLQGNNSYSYMPLPSVFQGVQDCRLPALKRSKRSKPFRRPPRQQLLQLQLYTCPCTCPCHLFFRGFKTAVCPPSNAPNPPAGLQGNNSYSYMPLPSVFQWVQDCRLPALQRSKPFRRPPRQQLLQLHASAICFSGGSRLPFARPQTLQTLQTLPQASQATTTLTATCPCHLFFRGFKTAVCPPSNAPNPSAGLQGNNSYSYMPLPSVFQGVQDCRLPALKRSKRSKPFRRPPRQQLLQLQLYTCPCTCPCHLFFRGFKTAVCPPSNAPNPSAGLQGNNSYSYMPLRQQLLQLHASAICFSGGSRLPFARPQTLQTLPQASKATTLTATCPCHLFFRGCKTAVCPPSNAPNPSADLQGNNSYSYMPLPSVFQGVQDCRLPALKRSKRSKPFRRPPRQQLLQLYTAIRAPAICFSRGSRLPFARPQTLQTLPQASKATTLPQTSKATTLTATCPCHLFFRGFKTAVCPPSNAPNPSAGLEGNNSYSYMPLPAGGACRLPASNAPNPSADLQGNNSATCPCHLFFTGFKTAVCPPLPSVFQRLPFARPQTLQTLPQASKARTLTATCPCHLFFRGFKTAVCPPSNAPNLSAGLQGNNSYSYIQLYTCPCHLFLKTAVCPPSNAPNAPNPSAGLQGNNSYSYMPLPSVFQGVQDCRLPALKDSKPFRRPPRQQLLQLHAPAIYRPLPSVFHGVQDCRLLQLYIYIYMPLPSVFQGVQDCRLPALKRSKPFRRPPREQLLQLHAPAICFSGGSRLPFARPQTLQTLPQASKATTLTATCLCHLFFRGFKTAVCPPSNAPNPSAGLQGNNSYSYMPLPSVFQGVQDSP